MHENTIAFIAMLKEVFKEYVLELVNLEENNLKIALKESDTIIAEMTLSSYDDVEVEHVRVMADYQDMKIFTRINNCLEECYYGVQYNIVCNENMYNLLTKRGYRENLDGIYEIDGTVRFMNTATTMSYEDLSAYPHASPDFRYVDMYKIGGRNYEYQE